MENLFKNSIFVFALLFSTSLFAEAELDKHDKNALKKTKELLESNSKRDMYYKSNPNAKVADDQVNDLVGGNAQDKQKIYELSSKIFERMVKEQGTGDQMKNIKQMLINAQNDPEGFANSLSDEEKKLLRDVSGNIEKRQHKMPNRK